MLQFVISVPKQIIDFILNLVLQLTCFGVLAVMQMNIVTIQMLVL